MIVLTLIDIYESHSIDIKEFIITLWYVLGFYTIIRRKIHVTTIYIFYFVLYSIA